MFIYVVQPFARAYKFSPFFDADCPYGHFRCVDEIFAVVDIEKVATVRDVVHSGLIVAYPWCPVAVDQQGVY